MSNQSFFFFRGGSEFTYLPKERSPNKASCIQSKVSVNNWRAFFSEKGERVLSPCSPTPPNSTQSKPNTKAFCSVLEVKIPWHFILFDNILLTEVKTMEICWFGRQGLQARVYHHFCGCTCIGTSLLLHYLYQQIIIKKRKKKQRYRVIPIKMLPVHAFTWQSGHCSQRWKGGDKYCGSSPHPLKW